MSAANALLFTDLDGAMVGLDDVIADGLERDYSGRYDGLRTLLEEGSPTQCLHACVMLASWGVRDGLVSIMEWAADPERVPWAGAPVSFDRMFGVDDGFAQLARALHTAGDVTLTPVGVRLRVGATRALLRLYDRVFFDRWMQLLLDDDTRLARTVRPHLAQAAERAVAACRQPQAFDLPTQAALLLAPLAALDDDGAASLAGQLTVVARDWPRTLVEVASALGSGTGSATRYALQRLTSSAHESVAREAQRCLERREAAGV